MFMQLIGIVTAFLLSFLFAAFLFFKFKMLENKKEESLAGGLSVVCGSVLSLSLVLPVFWSKYDFVSNVNVWNFIAPVIGLTVILGAVFAKKKYIFELGVLAASIIGVFAGKLTIDFFAPEYGLINKICSVVAWFLFSLGARATVGINPLLQIEGMTLGGGWIILFLFGVAPFMVGLVGTAFFAAMYVAYLYSDKIRIGMRISPVIGYFMGWFAFISYNELILPCFVLFSLFYCMEAMVAFLRKITFLQKYKIYCFNSVSWEAAESGLPEGALVKVVWSISCMQLLFGLLQINGVNFYSIPLFAGIIILWQFYRLLNWQEEEKSLKETNAEVVKQVKTTINTVVSGLKNIKNNVDISEATEDKKTIKKPVKSAKKKIQSNKESLKKYAVKKSVKNKKGQK